MVALHVRANDNQASSNTVSHAVELAKRRVGLMLRQTNPITSPPYVEGIVVSDSAWYHAL